MKAIYPLFTLIILGFFSSNACAQTECAYNFFLSGNYESPGNTWQKEPIQQQSKEFYLQKSKCKKNTAWILLGAGTTMAIGGAVGFGKSWDESSATKTDIFGFVFLAGVISDLVSIPFFLSSSKYKKKALSISFFMPDDPLGNNKDICLGIRPIVRIRF